MNILYINHYDRPNDAAAIGSYEMINGLEFLGHRVIVLTNDPYPNDETKIRHVNIMFPRSAETKRLLKFVRCTVMYLPVFLAGLRLAKRENIKCVFSQHHIYHFATITASILSSLIRVPHVVKIQNGVHWTEGLGEGPPTVIFEEYFMRILNRYALRRAKYVLALSSELKTILADMFDISSDRIIVIPNTIRSFSVKPAEAREMRQHLGMQNDKVLIFVGGAKGRAVEVLIKALRRVVSEEPNVKLLIVGQSSLSLKNLVEASDLEEHVHFTGSVPHSIVPTLISMSDVTIAGMVALRATVGGVPRKVLEYMVCGKPVISCHSSVSKDLLIDGYTGILVKPGDVDGLASAIIKLLRDEELAKEIGRNARRRISELYSQETLVRKLNMLMDAMSNEKRSNQGATNEPSVVSS